MTYNTINSEWKKDLFYAGHDSNAGRHSLESLSQGYKSFGAEGRDILPIDLQHLITRLESCHIGTAPLHHWENVAGSISS